MVKKECLVAFEESWVIQRMNTISQSVSIFSESLLFRTILGIGKGVVQLFFPLLSNIVFVMVVILTAILTFFVLAGK